MGYMYPLPKGSFTRTQNFGTNPGGVNPAGGHTGMDDAVKVGTPIYAPADGVIEWADWCRTANGSDNPWLLTAGGGITVVLNAGNAAPTFIFAHLSSTHLNSRARVRKGDIVGYSGNTGTWTTGPHLHSEALLPGFYILSPTYGRSNPAPLFDHFYAPSIKPASSTAPLKPNQRRAGKTAVNQRKEPKLHAPVVRVIPAGSLENWEGYVVGETVDLGKGVKSNLWLKDSKGYASVLFFDPTNVKGLKDLTPKLAALGPKERMTGASVVNQRKEPKLNAPVVRQIPAKSKEIFEGYVVGDLVDLGKNVKSNLWFKDSIGYASVLFFDPANVDGLPNLTPKPAPAPTDPAPPAYTFQKACELVTDVIPAAEGKYLSGNMPAAVEGVVVHQFIADATRFDVHLQSVINTFTTGERVASAHFGVEGKRVVQFVDLGDRAYHAGVRGNDHWSIEVYGGMDEDTLATVAALIRELNRIAGKELTLYRHRELMATACGEHVDLDKIRALVTGEGFPPPTPSPAPDVPPLPLPEPLPAPDPEVVASVLMRFFKWLVDLFLASQK